MFKNIALTVSLVILYIMMLMALQGAVLSATWAEAGAYAILIFVGTFGIADTLLDRDYSAAIKNLANLSPRAEVRVLTVLIVIGWALLFCASAIIEGGAQIFLLDVIVWPVAMVGLALVLGSIYRGLEIYDMSVTVATNFMED